MSKSIFIIGCGIVGKATGKGLIAKKHDVIFVDNNIKVVNEMKTDGYHACSIDEYFDKQGDITMICVSTPTNSEGDVEYSNIINTSINIGKWLKANNNGSFHVVTVRSTVPPFTTRNMILPLIEEYSILKGGIDFGIAMQPEFLRAVSSENDFLNPWITVIGEYDPKSGSILQNIYKDFCSKIYRTDLENAEFMKYIHNCYNATKISFSNEMWMLGQQLGLDANLALNLASESAEGFWNPLYGTRGGKPYEGTCLPKDVKGLISFTKKFHFSLNLLKAVDKVNEDMKLNTRSKEFFVKDENLQNTIIDNKNIK